MAHAEVARRLLHIDEDRLRMAVAMLARGGNLVLIDAALDLWPSTRSHLTQALPQQVFIEHLANSAPAAHLAISDPARDRPGHTIVLRIDEVNEAAIAVINGRREQLSRAAANFVLVVSGLPVHNYFVKYAPDCYSYLDLKVAIDGEPTMPPPFDADEAMRAVEPLIRWREHDGHLDPHRHALQQLTMAQQLRVLRPELAQRALDEAVRDMRALPAMSNQDCALLADVYATHSDRSSHAMRAKRMEHALEAIEPAAARYPDQRASLASQRLDALGPDLAAARQVLDETTLLDEARLQVARAYAVRDHITRARQILAETGMMTDEAIALDVSLRARQGDLSGVEQAFADTTEHLDWRAEWFMRRGESPTAHRLLAADMPRFRTPLLRVELDIQDGRTAEARAALEQLIDDDLASDLTEFGDPVIDRLLAACRRLANLTESEISLGSPTSTRTSLDQRLERVAQRLARVADLAPRWDSIHLLLLRADVSLRHGDADTAINWATHALELAEQIAPLLSPHALQRMIETALRIGELALVPEWLDLGLERSRQHEYIGAEARLLGLAVCYDTVSGRNPAETEARLEHALNTAGSVLLRVSTYHRIGTALSNEDLLKRAQRIYRGLPWPAREGACLEALGEPAAARQRYQAYKLVYCERLLDRKTPAPILAVDDEL